LDVRGNGSSTKIIPDSASGNLTNSGDVYPHGVQLTSNRNAKENFTAVNVRSVLGQGGNPAQRPWEQTGRSTHFRQRTLRHRLGRGHLKVETKRGIEKINRV